jgi:hypothetical protein
VTVISVNLKESHNTTTVPEDDTVHIMAVSEELQGGHRWGAVDSAQIFIRSQVLLAYLGRTGREGQVAVLDSEGSALKLKCASVVMEVPNLWLGVGPPGYWWHGMDASRSCRNCNNLPGDQDERRTVAVRQR